MPSLAEIIQEMLISVRHPRQGGERVLRMGWPDNAVWPVFALSVVLSTLAAEFNSFLIPPDPGRPTIYIAPAWLGLILFVVNATMAVGVASIGRGFGGTGNFLSALILISWQQLIAVAGLLLVTLVTLVLPTLGTSASWAFAIILIWILINYVTVLHGFDSRWLAAGVLVLAGILAGIVMMVMLGVLAVQTGELVPT